MYLFFIKDFGEVISKSKIVSINEWAIWLVSLILLLIPLIPSIKKVYIISTMDDFEKLITEKNQKALINLYQLLRGPISMFVFYFLYALLFSYLITNLELKLNSSIVSLGLLIILVFLLTILFLLVYILIRDLFGKIKFIEFLTNKKIVFKKSLLEITFYVNSATGLIFYTIVIQYLIYSKEPKNILETTFLILIPVLLFLLYKLINSKPTVQNYEYAYRVLEENAIANEEFVFLYNLDSSKTVLKKMNIDDDNEFIRVLYNNENNTYTEYKRITRKDDSNEQNIEGIQYN